jgi:tetrapyrrole methylase family protein/MazG family protein
LALPECRAPLVFYVFVGGFRRRASGREIKPVERNCGVLVEWWRILNGRALANPPDFVSFYRMCAMSPPSKSLPPLEQLKQVVASLRAAGGCPWDREQTHESLRAGLLEEAYEVVSAIEMRDDENLREELGDLLLQVVFHTQIAREGQRFDFEAVALAVTEKLVRRHPHVFGSEEAVDSAAVLVLWEEIKRGEKKKGVDQSVMEGVGVGLTALQRAAKTQKRAAEYGMDWGAAEPVLEKVREELMEVEEDLGKGGERLEEELGDLLFSVVNLARKLRVDAEVALRRATEKFARRFRAVEALAARRGLEMRGQALEKLDELWEEVKRSEPRGRGSSGARSGLEEV